MSHSLTIYDNIIFAMAPLGIITVIVGAIRTAGPAKLRAMIGRARENDAAAEVEYLSSVSQEVCEIWNGHSVVRIPGSPEIQLFVYIADKNEMEIFRAVAEDPSDKADGKTVKDKSTANEDPGQGK